MRRLLLASVVLLAGCSGPARPEDVALEYGRAIYAMDPEKMYRLLSAADRSVKDEATFRRQERELRGFTKQVVAQLASYITATPVKATVDGSRAIVALNFKLPDANAPAVLSLVSDWDEDRLNALSPLERRRITDRLVELHRTGALPTLEGVETRELVNDDRGWRVFLNWASGVRLRFGAAARDLPLELTVSPAEIVASPGERVRVTLRARNRGTHDVTARVGHRLQPEDQSRYVALLQCPLFVPVRLRPGETEEFVSEYLVLKDVPPDMRQLEATYEFRSETGS